MTCKLKDLTPIVVKQAPVATHKQGSLTLKKSMSASPELHLRHKSAEDAEQELEKFLDESVLAGLSSVRIVHGKGEGILRKLTHNLLRKHSEVKSFRTANADEGGEGVTVATFK